MRVQALYQECRAQHSWLPSNRRTPDIFLGSQSIPLHQAVKPTILADRLHTTRPPQRSFPQSQAEVPRESQDPGPSRPNDLTPNLRKGFPISCISRPVFSLYCVCAAVAQRLNGPAPRKSSCHLTIPVTNSVAG